MIRKVYMNGQVSTLLVFEESTEDFSFNPIFETLKEQDERIEILEEQNRALAMQEELLAHLVELTTRTEELMMRGLEELHRIEESVEDNLRKMMD